MQYANAYECKIGRIMVVENLKIERRRVVMKEDENFMNHLNMPRRFRSIRRLEE